MARSWSDWLLHPINSLESYGKEKINQGEDWLIGKAMEWGKKGIDAAAPAVAPVVQQFTNPNNGGLPPGPGTGGAPGSPGGDDDSLLSRGMNMLGNWLRGGKSPSTDPNNPDATQGDGDNSLWGSIGGMLGKGIGGIIMVAVLLIGLLIAGATGLLKGGLGLLGSLGVPGMDTASEAVGNFGSAAIHGVQNFGSKIENFVGSRGIRNNNAGNITAGNERWEGQVGTDGRFVVFDTREHGLRAMAVTLKNYQDKRGLDTVAKIVNTYAPPNENNTGQYVQNVAQRMGVDANQHIDLHNPETLSKLVNAMTVQEVGKTYDVRLVNTAVNDALNIQTQDVMMARNGTYPVQNVQGAGSPSFTPGGDPSLIARG